MRTQTPQVSFLVAGAQKAGTTALYHYLNGHPDVQMSRVKEAHFFDDDSQDWRAPDYGAYERLFTEDGRPCGEATPIYTYWPASLPRIARYNPAMRLICLFRDPAERAWSHWRMEYAHGRETEPFRWAIREGRARVDDPAAAGHHRVFSYVERGFYGAQVQRLLSLFPKEQALFLRADDLKDAPARTLARVCEFLGVPLPPKVPAQRRHVANAAIDYGGDITPADIAYLKDVYKADAELFASLTGIRFDGAG